jgi:branched-chain amino acid transport system ATP-binding protein
VSDIHENQAHPQHITAASGDPLLVVQDLHVRMASSHILQGICFEVGKGRVTAMLGRNGVGKTTCIKALLGIVKSEGRIALDGRPINGMLTHKIVRSGVGYVPEDREVFGGLTVEDNLKLAERPGTVAHYDLVHSLFPELKQRRKQLAGSLSGGQQQMVALGRVLINDTRLLLIDEPTKGLSPRLVEEVGDIIERIATHTTVVLVEQNLPLVRRIARDAIVLHAGEVVYSGSARGLLDDAEETNRHLGVALKRARS